MIVIKRTDSVGLRYNVLDLTTPQRMRAPAFLFNEQIESFFFKYKILPCCSTINKSSLATIITKKMYNRSSIDNRLCYIVQLNNPISHIKCNCTLGICCYITKITNMSIFYIGCTWTMSSI
jgi:hypothetical protein